MSGNEKKTSQLGMPIGTASAKLRKTILFNLLLKLKENICYQCGYPIENEEDLSIEHKIPYLDSDNPLSLFFDLENIGFSHLKCNVRAARRTRIKKHPSTQSYKDGCRCNYCKEIEKLRRKSQRARGIKT